MPSSRWLVALLVLLPGGAGAVTAYAATGTITTVVGDGTAAFSGDGGPAAQARIAIPVEVTLHPAGGYLIADQANQRVRRVGTDGTITTVAGSGTAGFQGDSGPAVSARLNAPSGIGVLPDGTLLIADANNNRVRRVTPGGTIGTDAGGGGSLGDGGPATNAQLAFPYDIAVAADGSYLIADTDNNRVRRVSSGGTITTVAGGGGSLGDGGPATSAALNDPLGVAFAADGAILVADTENNRVRRVANGTITTVAGNGIPGYTGDNGPATDARIDAPIRVSPAADGSFLVAERDNHVIRRVAADGTISTLAGDGTPGFAGDGGQATVARFNRPFGVTLTADNDVLVADSNNQRIRRVDAGDPPTTTTTTTTTTTPPPAAPPSPLRPPLRPPVAAFAQVATSPVLKGATTFDASQSFAPEGTTIVTYDWNVDSDPEPEVSCDAGQTTMTAVFPLRTVPRATRPATVSLVVRGSDALGRLAASPPVTRNASVTTSPLVKEPVYACAALTSASGVSALRGQCVKRIVFSIVEVTATGNGKCFFLALSKSYALKDFSGNSLGSRDALLGRMPAPVADTDTKSVTATVEGPVSVNGIRVPLPSATKTTYDLGTATLGLGRVPVELSIPGVAKPVKITELDLNKKVSLDPTGRFSLGSAKVESPGIKGLGGLKLGAGAEFALRRGFKSELKLALTLPNFFNDGQGKGVTGTVTVLGTHDTGFAFEGARMQIPFASIGPIALSNVFFDYQRTNEQLTGGFNVQILPDFGPVILASPEDGYGLQLRNGSFYSGGFGTEFPVAPQVFPGIGINNVGADFGINPLRLTGRLGLAFGETVVIDGTAFLALASKAEPYDFPKEYAPPGLGFLSGRRLDSLSVAIGASASLKLPVFGKVKVNEGYVFYAHPGLVEVGGNIDLDYKVKPVELSIKGKVGGFLDTVAELYNFEGNIEGCVKIDLGFPLSSIKPCLSTGGVVSSKGIGFCGLAVLPFPFPPVPIPVGAGKKWDGDASVKVFSCDYGDYVQENVRAAGQKKGKAAQAGNTVTLPAGLAGSMIRVTGRGGAPRVTVTPPGGTAIALPQTDQATANRDVVSFSDTEGATTIALRRPAKGVWRIAVQPGSPPIAKVETAESLPAPKVNARVTGSGAQRLLSYRIAEAPGQSVTFAERGRRTYSRIGEARGSSGTLRFTPADGAAGERRILAIVERGGVTRTLTVARYGAPGTARPAAPTGLRAQRRGTTISVAFRRVPGAEQYRVEWRPRIGVPTTVLSRRPRARVTDVDRLIPGTVSVTALKLDARPSTPARVRIATPGRRATRR